MLKGLHFILSYRCIFACDHCFVFSGPDAPSRTFTLSELRTILDDALKLETVEEVYFEGGEVFMLQPLLLEAVALARSRGYNVGIVTNAYFATDPENAELWLRPLVPLGIFDLSISDDAYHFSGDNAPARYAVAAAEKLGLPVSTITITPPSVQPPDPDKGQPIVGGDVVFRGRAVETLIHDLPRQSAACFAECPYEDLAEPSRVHIDPFGHVHLCQGLSMGNLWQQPLSEMVANYRVCDHPIAGPIYAGGPIKLAETYGVPREEGYVDACHLCYSARRSLLDRFPEVLAPPNVYGV